MCSKGQCLYPTCSFIPQILSSSTTLALSENREMTVPLPWAGYFTVCLNLILVPVPQCGVIRAEAHLTCCLHQYQQGLILVEDKGNNHYCLNTWLGDTKGTEQFGDRETECFIHGDVYKSWDCQPGWFLGWRVELVQQGLKPQVWEHIPYFKWKKSKDIFHRYILICLLSVR